MRKPPGQAAISKKQIADDIGYKVYTPSAAAVQVSRPSTIRSIPVAGAAMALYRFDLKVWLARLEHEVIAWIEARTAERDVA